MAYRDRGFLKRDDELIAAGHGVCEVCEQIVHDDAKADHFNDFVHKRYVVLTNRARAGWTPCVGHMASMAWRRGHPSEFEGARDLRYTAIEFVRSVGIEDLIQSVPKRNVTARAARPLLEIAQLVEHGGISWRRAARQLWTRGHINLNDVPDWVTF